MKTKYYEIFLGLLVILGSPQMMATGKVPEWKIIRRQNANTTKTDHPDISCQIKHDPGTEKLQICRVLVKGDLSKAVIGAFLLIEDENSVTLLDATLYGHDQIAGRGGVLEEEGKYYRFNIDRDLLEKAYLKIVTKRGLFKLKLNFEGQD